MISRTNPKPNTWKGVCYAAPRSPQAHSPDFSQAGPDHRPQGGEGPKADNTVLKRKNTRAEEEGRGGHGQWIRPNLVATTAQLQWPGRVRGRPPSQPKYPPPRLALSSFWLPLPPPSPSSLISTFYSPQSHLLPKQLGKISAETRFHVPQKDPWFPSGDMFSNTSRISWKQGLALLSLSSKRRTRRFLRFRQTHVTNLSQLQSRGRSHPVRMGKAGLSLAVGGGKL